MTLYRAHHKPTGFTDLPRATQTEATLDFVLLHNSEEWEVQAFDSGQSSVDEDFAQKLLGSANEAVPFDRPTEPEVDRMALEDEATQEGRLTPPAYRSVNFHD